MSMQIILNGLHEDICSFTCEYIFISLILGIAIIGFNTYGWLCMFNIVRDLGLCSESFIVAVVSDLIVFIFLVIPYTIGCTINCIYPLRPTSLAPHHSRLSYNELYTLQNYSATTPQISRVSPLKVIRSPSHKITRSIVEDV
jgi:hypothetical protein